MFFFFFALELALNQQAPIAIMVLLFLALGLSMYSGVVQLKKNNVTNYCYSPLGAIRLRWFSHSLSTIHECER